MKYKNKFYDPNCSSSGPEFYEPTSEPIEHYGALIFENGPKDFHIIIDGVCVGIYAGLNGAKDAVITRFGKAAPLRDLAS